MGCCCRDKRDDVETWENEEKLVVSAVRTWSMARNLWPVCGSEQSNESSNCLTICIQSVWPLWKLPNLVISCLQSARAPLDNAWLLCLNYHCFCCFLIWFEAVLVILANIDYAGLFLQRGNQKKCISLFALLIFNNWREVPIHCGCKTSRILNKFFFFWLNIRTFLKNFLQLQ